ALLVSPRQLRLQGEALRPRRAPAAARGPPRVEGDLLRRRARRAARPTGRLRPGRPLPSPVRRDRGRRPARPPAGRRPRALPRRRPAREDGPRVDGALARGSRAVPRPARDVVRPVAAAATQGARPREEGTAPPRAGAAPAAADRGGPQARLLDPGGGVAPRRAGAVCPRHALGRDALEAGLLRSGRGRARARPARRARGG